MKQSKWWIPVLFGVALIWMAGAVVHADSGDGWLGVYIQNVDEDLAEAEDLESDDGVLITSVIDDSPADEAGLRRGDIIIKFDNRDARSVRRLTRLIDSSEPGSKRTLIVWRNGHEKKITVKIGEDGDSDIQFFGGSNDFHFKVPDIDIRIPDLPSAPHVYSFSTGQHSSAHIGVSLHDLSDQLADYYGVKGGALINEVVDDSPAEEAGLKAGDVIVKMDGDRVDGVSDIREAIQDKDEDETVRVTVLRNGSEKTIKVGIEESRTWSGIGSVPRFEVFPSPTHGNSLYFHDSDDDDDDDNGWVSRRDRNKFRDAMRSYDRARGEHRVLRETLGDDWRDELREMREELREGLKELREELRELEEELP